MPRNLIDGSAPLETGFHDTEGSLAVREFSFQGLDQCLTVGPIRATASVLGTTLTVFRSKPIQCMDHKRGGHPSAMMERGT